MCERCLPEPVRVSPYADVRREGPQGPRCAMGNLIPSHKTAQKYADLNAVDALRRARGITVVAPQVVVMRRRRISTILDPRE